MFEIININEANQRFVKHIKRLEKYVESAVFKENTWYEVKTRNVSFNFIVEEIRYRTIETYENGNVELTHKPIFKIRIK